MAFVKKQFVYDLIKSENLKFFDVKDSDDKTLLFSNQDEDKSTIEAYNMLEDFLEEQVEPGTVVYVLLSDISRKAKKNGGNWDNRKFRVRTGREVGKQNERSIGYISSNEMGYDVKSLYEKNLQLHLENQKLADKLERREMEIKFQNQIDKLKDESPMEKYIPAIMGLFTQGKQAASMAAIHGAEEQTAEQQAVSNDKERLQGILKRLREIDKNYIDTLDLITKFAEKDSNKYFQFIPMIQTML